MSLRQILKSRNVRFAAVAFVLTFLVCFVPLEFYFMDRGWSADSGYWNHMEEPVPTTWFEGKRLEGEITSQGLRHGYAGRKKGRFRVLAIGDSFTYGLKLRRENAWPDQTERKLREAGYDSVEVLNAGRPGFNTEREFEFFRKYTRSLEPDLVILCFLINDATKLCSNCGAVRLKRELDEFRDGAIRFFGFYTFNHLWHAWLRHRLTQATIRDYTEPYETDSPEYRRCKRALLDFRKAAEEDGFQLIVLIYPMLYDLDEDYMFQEIHDRICAFLAEHRIPCYDLTPVFIGHSAEQLWISPDDSHPNAFANGLAAERIAKIVEEHMTRQP